MPTTLSPFRYLQVAQYLVRKWTDQVPRGAIGVWKGKGKGRAEPLVLSPPRLEGLLRSNVSHSTSTTSDSNSSNSESESIAGPSRHNGNNSLNKPQQQQTEGRKAGVGPDPKDPHMPVEQAKIYALMNDARLLSPKSVKPPREIVVLCHGLYGFSTSTPIPLFPSLKLHYWASVLDILREQMGCDVLVVGVKGTGSVKERAEQMHQFLKDTLPKGTGVNFVAHSMGGLDCRYLISNIKPTSYTPVSLTTIGTPHHGSPFMDWCAANIGVGSPSSAGDIAMKGAEAVAKALPYSLKAPLLTRPSNGSSSSSSSSGDKSKDNKGFTTSLTSYLLNIFDSPAYANLTTSYLRDQFNPANPDSPDVKYISVAGRISKLSVLHPLWFPKLVLDAAAENGYGEDSPGGMKGYLGNDGLVSVHSAQWGEFLGVVNETHHWELRGEGGLFPNTSSIRDEDKKDDKDKNKEIGGNGKGKEEEGWSLGWDWQGDFGNGVTDQIGSAASSVASVVAKVTPDSLSVGVGKVGKTTTTTNWDLAQVGQVLDWVTDLVPGGDNVETKKKQLADATKEKERDEERKHQEEGGGEKKKMSQGDKEKARKKKEKFELNRFYGGLMLKLRDEGF